MTSSRLELLASAAVAVVDDLLAEGATPIEVCGGFGVPEVAAVTAQVAGRAAVGHVTFSADALEPAAYARAAAGQ